MNRTGAKRLLKLAKFLEDHDLRFNMKFWARGKGRVHRTTGRLPTVKYVEVNDVKVPERTCGTASCAFGWAASMPAFIKQGLHWSNHPTSPEPVFNFNGYDWNGYDAAEKFFGISNHEAHKLFSPDYYNKDMRKRTVIRRIRDMVKEYHPNMV